MFFVEVFWIEDLDVLVDEFGLISGVNCMKIYVVFGWWIDCD